MVKRCQHANPGPPPRLLPVPDHLLVTSKDDLALALEDADRRLDPPVSVRVRWGGEWHTLALLHGWQQTEDRDDGWRSSPLAWCVRTTA